MRINNKMRFMPLILILLLVSMMALPMTQSEAATSPATVNLGTASSFAVLAGTTITNTGTTTFGGTAGGNIGLHPGTSITGITVTDSVYLTDTVALQAKNDLVIAYNAAAGRASNETISADLGGRTLTAGVYTSTTSIGLTGTLTLDGDGDPNAVFIFQAGSTLITASDSEILLINDAQACNVFWQVGSSATLGTDSIFVGQILALTSITANTRAEIEGQLLARNGAVTLDSNTITNDYCGSPGSLVITKLVQGVNPTNQQDFEITVTGPNGFIDNRRIQVDIPYILEGLDSGEYTVSEEASSEWSVSNIEDLYNVQDGVISYATVTNTYTPASSNDSDDSTSDNDNNDEGSTGELTVRKVVSGEIGDMTLPSFTITVTGPSDFSATRTILRGESYTWENLAPGTYTVTESRTGLSSEWKVSGEGTVQVRADQTALKTITNAYLEDDEPTGELTVTKVVRGNTGDMTLPLYAITVTGPRNFTATRTFVHGESYTWENLVPGTYTITENKTGLSSQWTVGGEGTVQVTSDETAVATITNAYISGVMAADDSTTTGDVETPALGIVELPRTGGNPLLMIFTGLFLLGMGIMLRRKEY